MLLLVGFVGIMDSEPFVIWFQGKRNSKGGGCEAMKECEEHNRRSEGS